MSWSLKGVPRLDWRRGRGFQHRRQCPLQPFKDCVSGVVGSWTGPGARKRALSESWSLRIVWPFVPRVRHSEMQNV